MEHEDRFIQENQESGQQKPPARRDKVVVTKVNAKELSLIKSTAEECGMTRSGFIRARVLGYKLRRRLSAEELDGLKRLAACRTDMVNFANVLRGLDDREKIRLFHHQPTMLEWYENVARVTDRVADFLQSVQTANSLPTGTTDGDNGEDNP